MSHAEPMVEPRAGHVVVRLRRKDAVLARGERIAWRQGQDSNRIGVLTLVRRKEVTAVPDQRTADRSSNPLLVERRTFGSKWIPCVQRLVSAEVEAGAFKPVRARSGGDRHDGI